MTRSILIIDDNEVERIVLTGFVQEYYNVETAKSGKEALTILHTKPHDFSAILLDIMMPDMNGFEVLSEIKANTLWMQIPVIVTSGLEDQESRQKALKYGVNGFVSKPYNRVLLLRSLQSAIQLHETIIMSNPLWHDQLTGLLNRESFFIEAERLIKKQKRGYYVLSCIDVDNFKIINDQYGTHKGDAVLRYLANSMNSIVLKTGGISCRFTADKFGLLYPFEYSDSDIVLKTHSKIINPECINRNIRIRIGRYIVNDINLSVSSMFDRATLAEESIKGQYETLVAYYTDSMRENLLHEQKVVNTMEDALNNNEFEVWFQPQFNHVTRKMIGSEALVRWRRDNALIPPGDFIPIFERNGFIYKLDRYIWRQVCKYLKQWTDEGKNPLPVSVNISRYDLFQSDFFESICDLVKEYKIPTELLRLEVTESAFSESTKILVQIVNRLISFGFVVEIDDFGSGYSSLNTLKDVGANILKLDMKFLEASDNSKRGGLIIESIVRMARWLDMAVIAEGVETLEQADYLKSIGCVYIQGYFYSKPIPLKEYENLCIEKDQEKEANLNHINTVDTWNNNVFWDPKSMETLIFNSFIGGACIFEYYKESLELLRFNNNYVEIFSNDFAYDYKEMKSFPPFLDKENNEILLASIKIVITQNKEHTFEVKLANKEMKVKYLRITMRLIAVSEERYLIYCVFNDLTELSLAKLRVEESAKELKAVINHAGNGIAAFIVNGEKSKLLFANEKYYDFLGLTKGEINLSNFDDVLKFVLPEYRDLVVKNIIESSNTLSNREFEYKIKNKDGKIRWVKTILSMTNLSGIDNPILIAVFSDISNEKESNLQLKFLNDSVHDILVIPNSNDAIIQILTKINDFFIGERAYLIEIDEEKQTTTNTYEVCKEGIEAEKDLLQNIPFNESDYWYVNLQKNNFLIIDDVNKLEKTDSALYMLLKKQKISSLIIVGLYSYGKLTGFFGLDNPKYLTESFYRLLALSDYFSILLTRRNLEQIIQKNSESQKELLDNLPCGAATYMFENGIISILHMNKQFWQLLNCKEMDTTQSNVLETIHPDDASLLLNEIHSAIWQKRLINCDIRIKGEFTENNKNDYKPFHVTAFINIIGPNKYKLYALYVPISSEIMSVQKIFPVALSTMMEVSTEFTYIKDENLKYLYCSNSLLRFLGLSSVSEGGGKSDVDLFDKDSINHFVEKDNEILQSGVPQTDFLETVKLKNGETRFFMSSKYPLLDALGKVIGVYGVSHDITKEKQVERSLCFAEEEYNIAIKQSGSIICRYDISKKTLIITTDTAKRLNLPECLTNIPYNEEELNKISIDTRDIYVNFFGNILNGCKEGSVVFKRLLPIGWRWIKAQSTTLFEENGNPVSAIVSYIDVTEEQEKQAVYKKWQQSLNDRDDESYTLFRYNLSKNTSFDSREGKLIKIEFSSNSHTFYDQVKEYTLQCVIPRDRENFALFLNSDTLLANFYRGERNNIFEYRESVTESEFRWIKLSVDLVEYPNSKDIQAFLMYEDIDKKKKAELIAKEKSETDPLTGILNRNTFIEKYNSLLKTSIYTDVHALLFLDIDNFKSVNDTYGHDEGDRILCEVTKKIQQCIRKEDIIGRFGGDEFFILLKKVIEEKNAIKKAKDICNLKIKPSKSDTCITFSIGISIIPRDGKDFDTLYKKVDKALYKMKELGKNGFIMVSE